MSIKLIKNYNTTICYIYFESILKYCGFLIQLFKSWSQLKVKSPYLPKYSQTVHFILQTLFISQDYFNEASMCQDEMEQVVELSERLLPSLDNNDTETLRQTLKQYTQRLNAVMAKSARKEELLKMKINEWNAFQVNSLKW